MSAAPVLQSSERRLHRATVTIAAPAGSIIFWDFRVLHRGLPNTTIHCHRPMLYCTVARSWFEDTINEICEEASLFAAKEVKVDTSNQTNKPTKGKGKGKSKGKGKGKCTSHPTIEMSQVSKGC